MLRPGYQRASSTNLSAGAPARPLEGKLAIITGGSRGSSSLWMLGSLVVFLQVAEAIIRNRCINCQNSGLQRCLPRLEFHVRLVDRTHLRASLVASIYLWHQGHIGTSRHG